MLLFCFSLFHFVVFSFFFLHRSGAVVLPEDIVRELETHCTQNSRDNLIPSELSSYLTIQDVT